MPRSRSNQSFHGGLNVAFINIRYNILQQQYIPISRNTFLTLFIPVILNFLELKYQGKDFSPFQTHPKTMRVVVVSLLLYCFAYDFEKRLCSPVYAHIVCGGRAVFGSLLSVSLASVLFQDSVWLALIFMYILFSNWEILNYRVKGIRNWFQRRVNRRNLLPV